MYPERISRPAMLRRTSRVKLARLGNKEVNDTNYKHDNNGSAAMIVIREITTIITDTGIIIARRRATMTIVRKKT